MSSSQLRPPEQTRPLIAVVCSVPLLGEAMESTLEFAEVRSFSGRGGDIVGLLQWVRPDAVIVDDDRNAVDAAAYAEQSETPLLHIAVRDRELRIFHRGGWHHVGNGEGPTPEAIRNVVAGALFARDGAR